MTSSQLDPVGYIEMLAERGDLPADGRLPTERALSEVLSCSRADVRRGLAQLEARGRITRHVGRGTYLRTTGDEREGTSSPRDLMVARLLWEPQVVDLAVLNAKAADLAEMERCLAGGDRATTYDDFEQWDVALHWSFAAATHNDVVQSMMRILNDSRDDPLWGGMKRRSFSPEVCREYRAQHAAIVEALRDRDRAAATNAMTAHLTAVQHRLLG